MNAETKWKIHSGTPVYGAESNPPLIEIQNQDPLDPRCVAWVNPQYASLITSAPDLLEACKAALKEMQAFRAYWTGPTMNLAGTKALAEELCEAAIKKAEAQS